MTQRPVCRLALLGAALALFFASQGPALAHRVNVFAYVEGDTVHVECSYSRTNRVRSSPIEVRDQASGKVYLTGTTDDQGNFAFTVPPEARAAKADLLIVLRAGEGHQNDWTVKAEEYLSAAPAAAQAPPVSSTTAVPPATKPAVAETVPAAASAGQPPALDAAALQAVVESAVEKKIAPLRLMLLSEKEKGPGLTEIAGGVGYLVGVAGLLAYVRSRGKGGAGS